MFRLAMESDLPEIMVIIEGIVEETIYKLDESN